MNTSAVYPARVIAININLLMGFVSAPLAMYAVGWYLWAALTFTVLCAFVAMLPVIRFLVGTEPEMRRVLLTNAPAVFAVCAFSALLPQTLTKIICLGGVFVLTGMLLRFGKAYSAQRLAKGK